MNDERSALAKLVHNIYAARDNDIQCDQAIIKMTRCADALYSEEEAKREFPELWRHLEVCTNCAEDYQALMALATLEAEGKLEEVTPSPSFLSQRRAPIWELAKDAITAIFAGFTPAPTLAVRHGNALPLNFKPVVTTLGDGEITIELEVKVNEETPLLLNLYCRVAADDPAIEAQFEASSIWLQPTELGSPLHIEALDELGDALFRAVESGNYRLRLRLAGLEYAIQAIELPQVPTTH